ncbi:polysaccharide pyruvyl transferase family protein [Hyphomonas atlantica]|uniref:polysaccharide pyruvyl transferase family protein n=1 Tax=Hyphomonas atlantica TaxID=1280948 RepID=UPI0023F27AF7|nr:polysaccharide pyruvyl transferase family protein [Hyphomonas atlantica]
MSFKRIGLVVPYNTAPTFDLNTDGLERLISANAGNLMFRYGVTSHIKDEYVPITFNRAKVDELKDKIDIIVYPTANQLNPKLKNLQNHAKFIRELGKPIIMVGLGAQSDTKIDLEKHLSKETIDYFKTVSDHTHSIGVRGAYTAEILERISVKNTTIIGCPSNFINTSNKLGEKLERRLTHLQEGKRRLQRFALFPQHGNSYLDDYHRPSEQRLFDWARRYRGATYVVNGPTEYYALARGHAARVSAERRAEAAAFFAPCSAPQGWSTGNVSPAVST